MAEYLPRFVDAILRDALETFGAVIIEGPRAVGKTSSGLQVAASSVRMDASPPLLALAENAPNLLLAGAVPRLIDEWQLAPTLWNAVRHEVDERAEPGQFVLTGSAQPADDVTRHSGAGRFRRVTLRPMTLSESGESTGAVDFSALFVDPEVGGIGGPTMEDYARLIVRGGWPALVTAPQRSASSYLTGYLDDIARVDLPGADVRVDPMRMSALIRALARNTATEISVAKLATEAEIAEPGQGVEVSAQSARKYLDALARVFVVEEQPAWLPHLRSNVRQRVRPKWHFIDPSLSAAALGATASGLLQDLNTLGLLFESLCVRDLRVYSQVLGGSVRHYRDETGLEVDAIVELADGRWAAFEVKLGGSGWIDGAASNLAKLARKVTEARARQMCSLNVLTAGSTSYVRPDGVNVIALGHLRGGVSG